MSHGFDPDYLLNLDLPCFNSLADSFQIVHDLDRYEHAWLTGLAFNDTKELHKQVNESRKKAKQSVKSGDDFVSQLKGGGC